MLNDLSLRNEPLPTIQKLIKERYPNAKAAFWAGSEYLKIETQLSQLEAHIELTWIHLHLLSEIDFRAEPLRELVPEWLKIPASDVFLGA